MANLAARGYQTRVEHVDEGNRSLRVSMGMAVGRRDRLEAELWPRDDGPFALDAKNLTVGLQHVECLADHRAADAEDGPKLRLRWQECPRTPAAVLDLLLQDLL